VVCKLKCYVCNSIRAIYKQKHADGSIVLVCADCYIDEKTIKELQNITIEKIKRIGKLIHNPCAGVNGNNCQNMLPRPEIYRCKRCFQIFSGHDID